MTMVHMLCQQVMDERRGKRIEEENIIFSTVAKVPQTREQFLYIGLLEHTAQSHTTGSGSEAANKTPSSIVQSAQAAPNNRKTGQNRETKTAFFFPLYAFSFVILIFELSREIRQCTGEASLVQ